jgi:hypothetical protein
MLNEASKLGIEEILSSLDDNTIFALATTVTQGLLKNRLNTRQGTIHFFCRTTHYFFFPEATNAILNYSPDAVSFLRRRIITREILLSYLLQKNISTDLPATKSDLVQRIANFWKAHYSQEVSNELSANTADSGSISLLAEQFTQWFYSMLNKNECLNNEHFYSDARLTINKFDNGTLTSETIENNPQEIVERLFLMRMQYNLFFNPNLSADGVQGRVDLHGLVLVFVCGTLHVEGTCVGVFEQVFGLVRDPLTDNNWKIKNSEINLKSQNGVTAMPTLKGSHLLPLR